VSLASSLDALLLRPAPLARASASLAAGGARAEVALARPAWPAVIAALQRRSGRPLLVVAGADEDARELASELEALVGSSEAVALWPSLGAPRGGAVGPSPHLVGQRARALGQVGRPGTLVVAGLPALLERAPEAAARPEPLELAAGGVISQEELVERLAALGYERVPQVEERGDVAVRGGLVDVFPTTADLPVRIDLFGDEIESIRAFSPFTQRTIREEARALAWAARDPEDAALVDPLDEVVAGAAAVVRLAPGEHPGAARAALERLEDEAAAGALSDAEEVVARLAEAAAVDLRPPSGQVTPAFDAAEARFAVRGLGEAEAELARLARARMRVVVAFARRGDMERAAHQMQRVRATALGPEDDLPDAGTVAFARLGVRGGFVSRDLGLALIPETAILRRRRPAEARLTVGKRLSSFLDLRIGDYVVHEDHGIGRLTGYETRTVANITRDYLALAYAGSDRLFVPHDQLSKVTRYVGADGSAPTLSKLGGKAWERLKARARAAARELAGELITLYEARARVEGFPFPPNDELMAELERAFPHRETPDQERAIEAVADDMERTRPMDRLICGDVGFGKTEIAVRAAFKAAAAGKQTMVLAPTTILAQQHLATFRERFGELPVTVDMINRFRSQAEVRETLGRFRDGRLDVLIGTHRLLSMDVQPKDLGLVIVDEEQRFGVSQKEALRQMRLRVDVLAMSATPIPRTLQMSLSGLRDISVIETPPPGRRPIATHVGELDEGLVREALRREASRGGQSFHLHNRVETIDAAADALRGLVPELRVLVAHGQMPEGELEDVMLAFVRGEADVLVCTSIIESGLDIPRANTLIVERADQLGLAQLYQIRGRVGRSNVTAHAYLLYPDEGSLTREAASRLRAVADYTELGSGLRIAMRDLEIRGAGNLLGEEQSGQVAAVGFELYVDLLQEAIAARQGEAVEEREVRVEIPVSAFIPAGYVPFEAAKIDLHRRIGLAGELEEVASIRAELEDRFGPVPDPVEALLALQELRVKLRRAGAQQLAARGGRLSVAPVSLTARQLRALREDQPRALYASRERAVSVPVGAGGSERIAAAGQVLDALLGAVALAA
jgi:transcription-repair coupling factor (superfamily II helicase)